MATLVVFEFPFEGPWGDDMATAFKPLAQDIAAEKGLIWKVWTEARERQTAGGAYLFDSADAADAYTRKHSERLAGFGIKAIDVRRFEVNDSLSAITRGR